MIKRSMLWFGLIPVCHCEECNGCEANRSKPGDSSLYSEQAPQSQNEIAAPYGLAMTILAVPDINDFITPVRTVVKDR